MTLQPLDYQTPPAKPPRAACASLGILSLLLFLLAAYIVVTRAEYHGLALVISAVGWVAAGAGLFLDRLKVPALMGIMVNLLFVFVIGLFFFAP